MKIDLSRVSYDGEWVDFGGIRLKIRPLPASMVNITVKDGGIVLSGADGLLAFDHCLTDQQGIVDAAEKPLKLTSSVKKMIYDFKVDPSVCPVVDGVSLVDFVLQHIRGRAERIADETKNSQPGQNGISLIKNIPANSADLSSEILAENHATG